MAMAAGELQDDFDVEQILLRAVRQSGSSDQEALRQRLDAAGRELGLTEAQIRSAEAEYYRVRDEESLRSEFDGATRREFWGHVLTYGIGNAAMLGIDFMRDGRVSWALWPLIAWGMAVVIHAFYAHNPGRSDYEKEFKAWKRKRDRRCRRRSGEKAEEGVS